jgi:NAD(P)-dependent dehydrogenase (short-subunit alcohol dehydrogenase family)
MSDALFSVADQVVVVSGGSRGIGRAIAQGFAERGATVIATGRDREALERAAAAMSRDMARVHPCVCDVSRTSDIKSLVEWLLDKFHRVDVLINVAGVNRRKPAVELTEDDYDFVLDTNLKGAFLLSQAIGKQMIGQGTGCQINIASLNTDRPLTHVLPYAVSKAGIGHLTRALALEWGPLGVRVNAIAPGFILTDLTRKLWSNEAMQMWGRTNTPLQRLGQPEDLVGTALFLASPAAAFITGQTIYVDGGFTAGWAWPIPPGGGQS